jgi:hypothetical protein
VRDVRFGAGFEAAVELDKDLRVLDHMVAAGGLRDNSK